MEKEIWKTIITEDGIYENYQVSNLGRLKSLKDSHGNYREKILSPGKDRNNYLHVILSRNGKRKNYLVHRIVAMAFIPNIPNYKCVDHINTIRTDNRVENLRFCTHKQNMNNKLSRIHNSQVRKNRKDLSKQVVCLETGEIFPSTMEASRQLGIDFRHISDCCLGKRKTTGKLHWKYI